MSLDRQKKLRDPDKKDLEFILGLFNSNKFIHAKKEIDKQILKFPNSPILFNILGAILADQNHYNKAIENYKKSLKINPSYAEAYNNLGVALHKLNKIDEAIYNYEKAIRLKNNFVEALNNLANAYQDLGLKKDALDNFKKVTEIKPDYAEPYNNIGMILSDISKFDEALINYNKAIELKPNFEKAYNNLGNLFHELGKHNEATKVYYKALKIKPNYAKAYSNLLLNLNYMKNFDPNKYLQEAKNFNFNCKPKKEKLFNYNYVKNPKRLKIGFVSSDFGNHPGGYFTLSTLREMSKKNFDLIAYSTKDRKDELAKFFKNSFLKWHSIEMKDEEDIVDQIVNDGIHILIDAQGHSANNKLPIFIYKPAPIQISWLGQGSSGISKIDYFIGSSHLIPNSEEKYYVEKIFRLPEISQCFTPPNFDVKINNLPALKNNFITFGCINKFSKINEDVIELWSKILNSVPNSKIILKCKEFDNKEIYEGTLYKFKKHKVKKENLILYGKLSSREEVFKIYNKIDISLDPFPYQGHTSSIESSYMGVPVLTLKGNRYLSRFGESINYNLNMREWIAENKEDYISKAIKFSSNIENLSYMRKNLRHNILKSPICDAPRFAKNFSSMLWEVWENFNKQITTK